jgi:enoyl-[acyl-carrier protein] reductase II
MLLNEILKIKYPIVQGAMANIATAEFAAAVSNAGALGVIATGAMNPQQVADAVARCRSLTEKPFGVNVMMMNHHSPEIFEVLYQLKPAVVTTGAGNPGPYMEKLKEAGIIVIPVVPTVSLAIRMQQAGADMVIVEGTEAGGHVGEMTTMALVPQAVDSLNIPVIAAGGIGDGRGFASALMLGAIGVQMGTLLLASEECPIHENYKNAVLKAKDSDTVVTGRSVSAPVRIMRNPMSQEYLRLEKEGATRDELEKLTLGSLRKAVFDGDVKNGSVMMGQIAGMIKEVKPLKQIFEDIVLDAKQQLPKLQGKLDQL